MTSLLASFKKPARLILGFVLIVLLFIQSPLSVSASHINLPQDGPEFLDADLSPVLAPADADDIGFYVPSSGKWFLKNDHVNGWSNYVTVKFPGPSGVQAVTGDWNNNDQDTIGFYVESAGKWYLKNDLNNGWSNYYTVKFPGPSGAQAVAGDWDNNGKDTVGFYVPSSGKWFLKTSHADGWGNVTTVKFPGASGSEAVSGDWNNNGSDTIGFYEPSGGKWYLKNNLVNGWSSFVTVKFPGAGGSQAIAGDWDGDGDDTIGFYVPSGGKWYLKNNTVNGWNNFETVKFPGPSGAQAVTGLWETGQSPTCYSLTRNYTGSGSAPTASPSNSTGCSSGYYTAGEAITLTPNPASGWGIGTWSGTNCTSCSFFTMPASSHTVTANYVQTSPTELRIINDLYDVPQTGFDWSLYNSIIWVKVAPTCGSFSWDGDGYPSGGTELMWPNNTTSDIANTWRIPPDYLSTSSYMDFDISGISTAADGSYCLLFQVGWWDSIYSVVYPYNFLYYEKTPSMFTCCDNSCCCAKGVYLTIIKPYGDPEEVTAGDWMPYTTWPGHWQCP